MLSTKKSLRISSIRRAASKIPGVPGNLLINGQWFSSREWRNILIGAGMDPLTPVMAFQGATIVYQTLSITQAELDAVDATTGKVAGEVKVKLNGRDVTFKKVGDNNVNMEMDFTSISVAEGTLASLAFQGKLAKSGTTRPVATPAPVPDAPPVDAPVTTPAPGATEQVVHEDLVQTPVVTAPVTPP
jgi:hypothetical protein